MSSAHPPASGPAEPGTPAPGNPPVSEPSAPGSPDSGLPPVPVSIVVPTLGRSGLGALLRALGPLPDSMELVIVDDRANAGTPLDLPPGTPARVVAGRAAGPAAARNIGWRAARHEWIAFLDDDVLPEPGWAAQLAEDLRGAGPGVGGVQGRLWVPLPAGRRLTDWERVTAGLADGEWITADMAYRRAALARTGGFDERLPRAFREDAELAHRVRRAGWQLRRGVRSTAHPVRPEQRWVSIRTQRGNADDALLRRLYGPDWRTVLGIPPGRRHRHAAVTACLALALAGAAAGLASRRRHADRPAAGLRGAGRGVAGLRGAAVRGAGLSGAGRSTTDRTAAGHRGSGHRAWSTAVVLAAAGWAAGTAEFAAARIAPGPRDRREVTTMLLTSVVIPPVAVAHWLRGWFRWRTAEPLREVPAELTRVTAPGGTTPTITAPTTAVSGGTTPREHARGTAASGGATLRIAAYRSREPGSSATAGSASGGSASGGGTSRDEKAGTRR